MAKLHLRTIESFIQQKLSQFGNSKFVDRYSKNGPKGETLPQIFEVDVYN